jgi:crotonobetainyl-CoA:carnitine CoA-transferase CaiB-like acyl-CoA transferase
MSAPPSAPGVDHSAAGGGAGAPPGGEPAGGPATTSRLHRFLAGTRVLDLSRHLPGPLATLLLADMGADVLKIEAPGGDELRAIGPRTPDGRSLYFDAINAGKRSIRLDLKSPAGRAALLEHAAGADVLVESFRPGVMQRLGLGAAVLRAANPRLICVAMSGYGQEGPLRDVAGHDANYLAINGLLSATGLAERRSYPFPPIADCTASMFAVSSILGALLARERDGQGCEIDLALADVVMPFQIFALAELGAHGHVPRPERELLNGGWACYRPYRTSDGHDVTLGAVEPHFWAAFCTASGRPDWLERHGEPLPQHALIAELDAHFSALTLADCIARYGTADCCFAPVADLAQAVESPHLQARGLVRRHPASRIYEAAYPVLVDGLRPSWREPLHDDAQDAGAPGGRHRA